MRWYIYDKNVINTTVFRLRFVNSICSSSDEKDVNETVEDEGEVTELAPQVISR